MPHFRWKPAGLLIAALLLASQPGSVPAAEIASLPTAREAAPRMFGKREIHSSNLSQFTRWTGLLARWKAQRAAAKSCNAPDAAAPACTPPEWTGLVERLRGLPLRRQLAAELSVRMMAGTGFELLARLNTRFAGQGPTLFTDFDEYSLYVLRGLDVGGPDFVYPPPGAASAGTAPGTGVGIRQASRPFGSRSARPPVSCA